MVKEEIKKLEDELQGLLEKKIERLKAKRKYIRVRGRLVPNDPNAIDPESGKKITDIEDD
jgi:hypothetical protein